MKCCKSEVDRTISQTEHCWHAEEGKKETLLVTGHPVWLSKPAGTTLLTGIEGGMLVLAPGSPPPHAPQGYPWSWIKIQGQSLPLRSWSFKLEQKNTIPMTILSSNGVLLAQPGEPCYQDQEKKDFERLQYICQLNWCRERLVASFLLTHQKI